MRSRTVLAPYAEKYPFDPTAIEAGQRPLYDRHECAEIPIGLLAVNWWQNGLKIMLGKLNANTMQSGSSCSEQSSEPTESEN